jgi:16S rRNA G966 N2-methylase RsmD
MVELISAGGWLKGDGQLLMECGRDEMPLLPKGWRQIKERRYGRSVVLQWELEAG